MKQIRIGNNFFYKKDEKSGFWINQRPSDPQSSTLTNQELIGLLNDELVNGDKYLQQIQDRMSVIKNTINFLQEELSCQVSS
jgi:hypothetical protein